MPKSGEQDPENEAGWQFGDVWKDGTPDDMAGDEGVVYVDILRADTGRGFSDSVLLDLVGYLGSCGIRATYEAASVAGEGGGIKTYVLKVEAGKEEEAVRALRDKMTR